MIQDKAQPVVNGYSLNRRNHLNSCVITPVRQRRGTETRLDGGGSSLLRTRLTPFSLI
jgi:hypothetical protein